MKLRGGGPPSNPRLAAMWQVDAAAAAREVLGALDKHASVTDAAAELGVGRRTLFRWMAIRPELSGRRKRKMKSRDLNGAINRAAKVYVIVEYAQGLTFWAELTKVAAKELSNAAKEENADVDASVDGADLYIGHVPPDLIESDTPEGSRDEEE